MLTPKKYFLGLFLVTTLLTGCSSQPTATDQKDAEETSFQNIQASNNMETPSETTVNVSQTANYKIEFIANWSPTTHPEFYPTGAHFSPFIAYSHNNSPTSKIFNTGKLPTVGIEKMAETGATNILTKEIQNIIDSNFARNQIKGNRINSPGNNSAELTLSQEHSHITFVSMLAPSPDWFVSTSTNLFKDGQWLEKTEIELLTYDAGSDDGEKFESKDQDSNPKQPITVFDNTLQNLGKIIITKLDK